MKIILIAIFSVYLAEVLACKDKYTHCKNYTRYGWCKEDNSMNDFMKRRCPLACGFCATAPPTPNAPTTKPGCVNAWTSCDNYDKEWCKQGNSMYDIMRKYCPKMCGFCGPQKTAAPTPQRTPGTLPPPGSCGVPSIAAGRVISGENSKAGQWPWQVAMLKYNRFNCGGSLISPNWVVTAAHCVASTSSAVNYKIVVGDLNRIDTSGEEQTLAAERVIAHSQYQRPTAINNDIALIKLKTPARLGKYVKTICLPEQDEQVPVGSKCYISGWGKIRHPGSSVNQLQHAALNVISNTECKKLNKKIPVTEKMVCASNGVGTTQSGCHGDSGGPFVCEQENGSWKLHGAVSWGSPRCDISEANSVFARISEFRDWIDEQMSMY